MSFYEISLNFWTAFLYYRFEMLLLLLLTLFSHLLLVLHITVVFQDSSVCLLIRLQAELRMQSNSWQGQQIFLFSKMPRLTQPFPPLLLNMCQGFFPWGYRSQGTT